MAIFDPTFGRFFLNEQPRAAYGSAALPFGTSPAKRRFVQGSFDDVWSRFLAQLGLQARAGFVPDLDFGDFTANFDFNKLFQDQPRFARGQDAQQFNPRTRFLFGF